MEGNTFFVIEEENTETGKIYAWAETVPNSYNLLNHFSHSEGCRLISVNACKTLKEARAIANAWNEAAKEKGNYIYA